MENYLVLDREPFVGFFPNDLRNWLAEHTQELEIALSMMFVHEKTGVLGAECDETTDYWVHFAFEEWYELETELVERIKEILALDNKTKGTNYPLDGIGTHYIIKPFMERNGYRDGSGWWIKA